VYVCIIIKACFLESAHLSQHILFANWFSHDYLNTYAQKIEITLPFLFFLVK